MLHENSIKWNPYYLYLINVRFSIGNKQIPERVPVIKYREDRNGHKIGHYGVFGLFRSLTLPFHLRLPYNRFLSVTDNDRSREVIKVKVVKIFK